MPTFIGWLLPLIFWKHYVMKNYSRETLSVNKHNGEKQIWNYFMIANGIGFVICPEIIERYELQREKDRQTKAQKIKNKINNYIKKNRYELSKQDRKDIVLSMARDANPYEIKDAIEEYIEDGCID